LEAPHSNVLEEWLANLIHFITLKVFKNISNSLFSKHQLMFAFFIAVRIGLENGRCNEQEWRSLLTGTSDVNAETPPNRLRDQIPDAMGNELFALSQVEVFRGFQDYVVDNCLGMMKIGNLFTATMGGGVSTCLNLFLRLCTALPLAGLPHRRIHATDPGRPREANLSNAFQDSSPTTPIISS
jgi:dynein heavy chain